MVALEDFLTFSGARYVVDFCRLEKRAPSMLLSFCLVLYMRGTGHLCCERRIWQLLVLCLGFLGRTRKLRRMEKCAHLLLQLLVEPRSVRTWNPDIISTSFSSYLAVTSTSAAESVFLMRFFALFFELRRPGR